jgi:hypothetical protein
MMLPSSQTVDATKGEFICPATGEFHFLGESYRDLLGVARVFSTTQRHKNDSGVLFCYRADWTPVFIQVPPGQVWTVEFAIECRKRIHGVNK